MNDILDPESIVGHNASGLPVRLYQLEPWASYRLGLYPALIETLLSCQRLFDEALPKFNWGASALDANAIGLLNTVPITVKTIISQYPQGFKNV